MTHSYDPLNDTKRSLRLFVALLYGAEIKCEHLCGVDKAHKVTASMINENTLPLLANVCAYAEYFGCWIADKVIPILTSSSAYGEAIALEPKKHCLFAKRLKHADLYRDALRHMIAQAPLRGWWRCIAQITGWGEDQIREYFIPQFEDLRIRTQNLREELQKLQLGRVRAEYEGFMGVHETHTRLLDMIAIGQAPSRVQLAAGFIWSEYLVYQLNGVRVLGTRDSITAEPAGYVLRPLPLPYVSRTLTFATSRRLNLLIHKIQKAAISPNPAALCDAATTVHYAEYFRLSKAELRELEQRLHGLVREANHLIETAFPVTVAREHSKFSFADDWERVTELQLKRCWCCWDTHSRGFTSLSWFGSFFGRRYVERFSR